MNIQLLNENHSGYGMLVEKECKICGNIFKTKKTRIFYCSDNCKKIHYDKVKIIRNKNNFKTYGVKNVFQLNDANIEKYGVCHYLKTNEGKQKLKETNVEKYGCVSPMQNEKIKEKTTLTTLKNFGVIRPMQHKTLKKKILKNNLLKNGKNNFKSVREKYKKTMIEKYGIENSFQSEIVKEKIKKTNIKRYGVFNPIQNEEIFNKAQNGKNWKIYKLPSGKIVKIQGYENKFLDEYFKNCGLDEDIIIHPNQTDIGKIFYTCEDNKKHRYYPDFYIPKDKMIVEVKSTWTYNKDLNINILKEEACLSQNHNFVFKIY